MLEGAFTDELPLLFALPPALFLPVLDAPLSVFACSPAPSAAGPAVASTATVPVCVLAAGVLGLLLLVANAAACETAGALA